MNTQANEKALPPVVRQEIANAEAQDFMLIDMDVSPFPFSQKYLLTFVSGGRGATMEARIVKMEYYPDDEKVVGYENIQLYVSELVDIAAIARNEAILADRKGA